MPAFEKRKLARNVRLMMIFFIIAVIISGATAFDVESGLKWLTGYLHLMPQPIAVFLTRCYEAVSVTNKNYPMIAYGYDWLAFAHLVIALMFIGPYINPVKNQWVIHWAIIACIAVFPLALIAGPLRGIPFYWQLIDCSFGILGLIPLLITNSWINRMRRL